MTESDARWGGRGTVEWGGVGWGRPRHGTAVMAWLGRVGYGICLVREFSICLVGGGSEWGSGRI